MGLLTDLKAGQHARIIVFWARLAHWAANFYNGIQFTTNQMNVNENGGILPHVIRSSRLTQLHLTQIAAQHHDSSQLFCPPAQPCSACLLSFLMVARQQSSNTLPHAHSCQAAGLESWVLRSCPQQIHPSPTIPWLDCVLNLPLLFCVRLMEIGRWLVRSARL